MKVNHTSSSLLYALTKEGVAFNKVAVVSLTQIKLGFIGNCIGALHSSLAGGFSAVRTQMLKYELLRLSDV